MLKLCLISAPVLVFPRNDYEFLLDMNASDYSIGVVLSQMFEGKEMVLAYFSKALRSSQQTVAQPNGSFWPL